MNTYTQDKLLEKHICRFNDGECNCDCYIAGITDYHNHIVEKIKLINLYELGDNPIEVRKVWRLGQEAAIEQVLSLLQDTKDGRPTDDYVDRAIERYKNAKKNGTLDKEFPRLQDTNPKE